MDQYLCMAFAQLTYREGLRDIECCLRAHQTKLYHMGMRTAISRSTLAHANEHRDWRIWGDFAQALIREAREMYHHHMESSLSNWLRTFLALFATSSQ